jgi:hypothetical protein
MVPGITTIQVFMGIVRGKLKKNIEYYRAKLKISRDKVFLVNLIMMGKVQGFTLLEMAMNVRTARGGVGHAVAQLVKGLLYKPQGRGYDSR